MFEVGEVYNRRSDIHGPYGGSGKVASLHPAVGP
jgi:hypothetical protein